MGNHNKTVSVALKAVAKRFFLPGGGVYTAVDDITFDPESFRGADPAVYLEGTRNTLPTFSSDGVMEEQGAEAVLEVLSLSLEEVRNTDIDLTKTYTNEFVE